MQRTAVLYHHSTSAWYRAISLIFQYAETCGRILHGFSYKFDVNGHRVQWPKHTPKFVNYRSIKDYTNFYWETVIKMFATYHNDGFKD